MHSDLEKILRLARTQRRHSRSRFMSNCISHSEDDDDDLARCTHLVDRAYRIPAVSALLFSLSFHLPFPFPVILTSGYNKI